VEGPSPAPGAQPGRLSIIAALSLNRVIGRDQALPWHLPADLRRFKRLTLGHHLIVGRRTFEAIGRPLPGRRMIVVSRQPGYAPDGVEVSPSIDAAIRAAAGDAEVFIGGGAAIFAETLGRADRLYLTIVEAVIEGDALFPPYDESAWRTVEDDRFEPDERHRYPYRFVVCDRIV
jgi:dihydrofolate reductase